MSAGNIFPFLARFLFVSNNNEIVFWRHSKLQASLEKFHNVKIKKKSIRRIRNLLEWGDNFENNKEYFHSNFFRSGDGACNVKNRPTEFGKSNGWNVCLFFRR